MIVVFALGILSWLFFSLAGFDEERPEETADFYNPFFWLGLLFSLAMMAAFVLRIGAWIAYF